MCRRGFLFFHWDANEEVHRASVTRQNKHFFYSPLSRFPVFNGTTYYNEGDNKKTSQTITQCFIVALHTFYVSRFNAAPKSRLNKAPRLVKRSLLSASYVTRVWIDVQKLVKQKVLVCSWPWWSTNLKALPETLKLLTFQTSYETSGCYLTVSQYNSIWMATCMWRSDEIKYFLFACCITHWTKLNVTPLFCQLQAHRYFPACQTHSPVLWVNSEWSRIRNSRFVRSPCY